MAKRRTNKEIREVDAVHNATFVTACEISDRVNGKNDLVDDAFVSVRAYNIGNVRAEFQLKLAANISVSFDTADAKLAERVALAIKAELSKS